MIKGLVDAVDRVFSVQPEEQVFIGLMREHAVGSNYLPELLSDQTSDLARNDIRDACTVKTM